MLKGEVKKKEGLNKYVFKNIGFKKERFATKTLKRKVYKLNAKKERC